MNSTPLSDQQAERERFARIVRKVADGFLRAAKFEDLFPDTADSDVWAAYGELLRSFDMTTTRANGLVDVRTGPNYPNGRRIVRGRFVEFSGSGSTHPVFNAARRSLYSPTLAVATGIANALAKLSEDQLAEVCLSHREPSPELRRVLEWHYDKTLPDGSIGTGVLDERPVLPIAQISEALYAAVQGAVYHADLVPIAGPTEEGGSRDEIVGGLPVGVVVPLLESLDKLNAALDAGSASRPFAKSNFKVSDLPRMIGKELATKRLLPTQYLFRAASRGLERGLHNEPATLSARGAYFQELRERSIKEGTQALASAWLNGGYESDASNRAVAYASPHVAYTDWLKGKHDPTLEGTDAAVMNPTHFNVDEAVDGILHNSTPHWRTSVMLHGEKVPLNVRAFACDRLLKEYNQRYLINPNHIYHFLTENVDKPELPDYYWKLFLEKVKSDLDRLMRDGKVGRLAEYRKMLKSMAQDFYDTFLHGKSVDEVLDEVERAKNEAAPKDEDTIEMMRPGFVMFRGRPIRVADAFGNLTPAGEAFQRARQNVQGKAFIADPRLLEALLLGLDGTELPQKFLTLYQMLELPVRRCVVDWAMHHKDAAIQQLGLEMLPNVQDIREQAMAFDIRIEREREMVEHAARMAKRNNESVDHGFENRRRMRDRHAIDAMELAGYAPTRTTDIINMVPNADPTTRIQQVLRWLRPRGTQTPLTEEQAWAKVQEYYLGSTEGLFADQVPENPNARFEQAGLFGAEAAAKAPEPPADSPMAIRERAARLTGQPAPKRAAEPEKQSDLFGGGSTPRRGPKVG